MKSISFQWTEGVAPWEAETVVSTVAHIQEVMLVLGQRAGLSLNRGELRPFGTWVIPGIPRGSPYWSTRWYVDQSLDKATGQIYAPKFINVLRDEPWQQVGPHYDVAVVHVAPPDGDGLCSLGTSTSYPLALARLAPTVIAQVNPRMPRVAGDASLHISEIDWLTEVDDPLGAHERAAITPTAATIGDHLAALIPSGTTLQVGIGAIPEALLQNLCHSDVGDLRIYGMGVDAIVALAEAGRLRSGDDGRPSALCAELMGTTTLFDYADGNPALEMHPFDTILDPAHIASFEGFVSVNSAVQVDLMGQANVEHLGGAQLSGVGGGYDFAQGAWLSPGGKCIIAMPSTNRRGDVSRIVAQLDPATPVGVPRHFTQYVVTEHGVADLAGLGLRERAEALIALAAPQFRDELADSVG